MDTSKSDRRGGEGGGTEHEGIEECGFTGQSWDVLLDVRKDSDRRRGSNWKGRCGEQGGHSKTILLLVSSSR